jgi:hypothetical protein
MKLLLVCLIVKLVDIRAFSNDLKSVFIKIIMEAFLMKFDSLLPLLLYKRS